MSGHSKWATTKHQKAVTDARRGASFTKVANMISVAAREGADPEFNFKLRLAVDKAKSVSMPKENIDRAIARGAGKGAGAAGVEELVYEAYGPGGSALIITALTDNKMRAFTDIRSTVTKNGGRMADAGSVSYMFDKKGLIIVSHKPEQGDEIQLAAIDLGADDVDTDGELTRIITPVSELQKVRQGLIESKYNIDEAKLDWVCKTPTELSDEDQERVDKLIDALDSLDDVTDIATNIH